jgi:hypothetical protein
MYNPLVVCHFANWAMASSELLSHYQGVSSRLHPITAFFAGYILVKSHSILTNKYVNKYRKYSMNIFKHFIIKPSKYEASHFGTPIATDKLIKLTHSQQLRLARGRQQAMQRFNPGPEVDI